MNKFIVSGLVCLGIATPLLHAQEGGQNEFSVSAPGAFQRTSTVTASSSLLAEPRAYRSARTCSMLTEAPDPGSTTLYSGGRTHMAEPFAGISFRF